MTHKIHSNKKVNRSIGGNIVLIAVIGILGLVMCIPVVYIVANAFKPINELFLWPPPLFPRKPTLDNFVTMFQLIQSSQLPASRYFFNSFFVAAMGTFLYILIASLCAYPLAKHDFKLKGAYSTLLVWVLLFRSEVIAIPQYMIISGLKLTDTYLALILPTLSGTMGVFMMLQFMNNIPKALIEAAKIDGAGEYCIYWKIIMPQVKPAWLTLLLFTFQGIWNTNSIGVSYVYSENMKMVPALLSQITSAGFARAGAGATVALLLLIVPVIIYLFCQSSIVETMSHAGIK